MDCSLDKGLSRDTWSFLRIVLTIYEEREKSRIKVKYVHGTYKETYLNIDWNLYITKDVVKYNKEQSNNDKV